MTDTTTQELNSALILRSHDDVPDHYDQPNHPF